MDKNTLILGPCSAETEAQVWETAKAIHTLFPKAIFRAGLWKPRTNPHAFAGVGEAGIPWLLRVQKELGMPVATEVATPEHLTLCLGAGINHLWIGARTTANPIIVQALCDTIKEHPTSAFSVQHSAFIYIKNPINPDIETWTGTIERFREAGVNNIIAIHRGFSTLAQNEWRNAPMWAIPFELKRRYPTLPIICDPSHIAGHSERVLQVAEQAQRIGFDGLMIECHLHPQEALSDAKQQITPETLKTLDLQFKDSQLKESTLIQWREQIDAIDNEIWQLLSHRMEISQQIGEYKREHQIPILHSQRYETILQKRLDWAKEHGISQEAVKQIMAAIHEESVKKQI